MKKLIILLMILFSDVALAVPFELATYDRNSEQQENLLEFEEVQRLALKCMYDKQWLDLDVDVQGGVSNRDKGFGPYQDTFAGLVLKIPLYSGKELDRERGRTLDRKTAVVMAATNLMKAIEQVIYQRKIIIIYKTMERRSQKRVREGVAGLDEQVLILEKIHEAKKQLLNGSADALGNRKLLIEMCKDGQNKKNLKNYLDRVEEMQIK
jgi:hypothetical protein